MKCPACEIELDEHQLREQVAHMELCHPEVIIERWRESGVSEEERERLLAEMDRRLPNIDDLLLQCEERGLDYFLQNMKDGRRGFYVTVCYLQKPIHSFHHRVEVQGVNLRSALALAMELAKQDKGVR